MEKISPRQRIIEVAEGLFFRHGYSRITTDDLAREAGMSKRTLYQHFSSKEEILDCIMEEWLHKDDAMFQTVIRNQDVDFAQRLRKLLDIMLEDLKQFNPALLDDIKRHTPSVWKRFNDHMEVHILDTMNVLIEEGIRNGIFRHDFSKEVFILIFTRAHESIHDPAVLNRLSMNLAQAHEAFIRILSEGILTDEGRKRFVDNG